jgi:hypothetical protein
MNTRNPDRLGGLASAALGVVYLLIGANYLINRAALTVDVETFVSEFARYQLANDAQWWLFVLSGVLGVAAVAALSARAAPGHAGLRWLATLANAGFLVTALDNARLAAYWHGRAADYLAASTDAAREAIAANSGALSLDPNGVFGFGLVGLWVIATGYVALQRDALPRGAGYAGLAAGLVYWLVVIGFTLNVEPLVAIAAGLGGIILAPVWYLWAGLSLLRPAPAVGGMAPAAA